MAYTISSGERGSIIECSGFFDIHELNAANGVLHGHPDFDRHAYQIWNLLNADLSGISEKEMMQPASTDKVAGRYAPKMKVALVVQDEHAANLCETYRKDILSRGLKWECRLFSCMEEARGWADA